MTATAHSSDELRLEAARIAVALLRFEELAAHLSDAHTSPGALRVGVDAYTFSPSWRQVPHSQVEAFLVALPSPVLLAPTTIRGVIALTLLHELSGERRRWAEKTYSNFATGLDELSEALGLSSSSRILLEFDDESHVFSLAGVREWSQQFAVQVGWNIGGLKGEPRADACMRLRRGDGQRFRGRSCMIPHWYTPPDPASGAA